MHITINYMYICLISKGQYIAKCIISLILNYKTDMVSKAPAEGYASTDIFACLFNIEILRVSLCV